ncbi:AAA family ATPase [Deinococcus sp. YIM 134068]|uniref:AAA family ATPase n=1 Tax=Deinococcus lichenicola TaxID=3118910 RepID=UPI002F947849
MLTLHLLGHVHVTHGQRAVPISAKAGALITYLAIEKLPQHRERLADLLWDTLESRKNLRVELARIRSAGLDVFPSSSQLLHLDHVTSDFDAWCSDAHRDMNERQLTGWLATLRGLPFTGLEDLGSSTFQTWVDQQRWLMIGQIEGHLRRAYWRHAREGHAWATRLIAERAEALGLDDPAQEAQAQTQAEAAAPFPVPGVFPAPSPVPALPSSPAPTVEAALSPAPAPRRALTVHFERPAEERELRRALGQAEEQARLIYLHGPAGSGKSYLLRRLAAQLDWATVPVACGRPARLVVAGLAQALLRLCDPADAPTLNHLLLHPAGLEEDVVKVAHLLSGVRRRVLLVFDQAQDMAPDLHPLLEFLVESCDEGGRAFVVLGREPSARVPLVRALLRRVERPRRLELSLALLPVASVQQLLEAQFPFEPSGRVRAAAARLLQRSEGNPLHLLSLLADAPNLESAHDAPMPQAVLDACGAELGRWPARLVEAAARLSVICGGFDLALASAALGEETGVTAALLHEALELRLLEEVGAQTPLPLPLGSVPGRSPEGQEADPDRAPAGGRYLFRSEGLRLALALRLPRFVRQEVRCRLAAALAGSAPGLAAYYAGRAGLPEEAARLRGEYRRLLPHDSPLHHAPTDPPGTPPAPVPFPVSPAPGADGPLPGPSDAPVVHQGYRLFHDRGGLNILSSARYGPAPTLTLRLPVPLAAPGQPAELRLLWRLDLYRGGEELGPTVPPFALRVTVPGSGVAHVLRPGGPCLYREEDAAQVAHAGVGLGAWMEHHLHLGPEEVGAGTGVLELSVRAVDLALTLAAVRWNGRDLPLAAPVTRPHSRTLAGL